MLSPQGFYQLHEPGNKSNCPPEISLKAIRSRRKTKSPHQTRRSSYFFLPPPGVSTKNYFRWPIKTVKLQLSGREPRYQCLPPPAACNGTLFPSSPWGGASKHLSQKQFFFPQQYLHKKNTQSLDPGKKKHLSQRQRRTQAGLMCIAGVWGGQGAKKARLRHTNSTFFYRSVGKKIKQPDPVIFLFSGHQPEK
jgi:hypothetical protein